MLVTLSMMGVAIALAVARLRSDRRSSILVLLLVAYAVFFTAQMCLGARKAPRYTLPAFLGLDVAAGYLNTLPDAPNTMVGVDRTLAAMLGRSSVGTPIALDDPAVHCRV
jgi:hypothetical protein